MIAGASITESRKESGWIFSDGYFIATQSMAVSTSSDIDTLEDPFTGLEGKSVAVKIGTLSAEYAESLAETYGFTVTYFEDSPTLYQAVIGGQCVAAFDDTPIMADNIKANDLPMKLVAGTEHEGAPYGFAVFSADMQELVDMFNAGLANIKTSGVYDEILAKYMGA